MKKLILAAAAVLSLSTSAAFADGFRCTTNDGELNVAVYNKVMPAEGTRNAAVMIVSNPNLPAGEQMIARFQAPATLSNQSTTYTGRVDLRFNGFLAAKQVGSFSLGELKTIKLAVDFSYANAAMLADETTGAVLYLISRDHDAETKSATCTRYLKN